MIKVLQVVDTPNWAIDTLASSIIKHNPHIHFRKLYIPPRGVDEFIQDFKDNWEWADIIHFQYWRTYLQIIEKMPEIKKKKLILTHHNEKNLLSGDWKDTDMIVVPTSESMRKITADYSDVDAQVVQTKISFEALRSSYPKNKIFVIPYGIDLKKFQWNDDYNTEPIKIGYVGRIKRWKRLKPIALACQELGVRLAVMGTPDDGDYLKEIQDAMGGSEKMQETIEWHLNATEQEKIDLYKQMTIYVGNSWDGRETGTLPLLEALAIGVPVLTTPSGIARDIAVDNENMCLLEFNNPDPKNNPDWETKNKDEIKTKLKQMLENPELLKKIRDNGWRTVKNMAEEKMARQYSTLYNFLLFKSVAPVSVIIPATYDRSDKVREILKALDEQTYPNIEAIVVWDEGNLLPKIDRDEYKIPIKELYTRKIEDEVYCLARARNLGVIEAEGTMLVFCDSRLKPEPKAIEEFVTTLLSAKKKVWLFGNKNTGKTTFVENWSCIFRKDLINGGMFNERVNRYGGMSQELRSRFEAQKFELLYVDSAKCNEIKSAGKWNQLKRSQVVEMKLLLFKLGL